MWSKRYEVIWRQFANPVTSSAYEKNGKELLFCYRVLRIDRPD